MLPNVAINMHTKRRCLPAVEQTTPLPTILSFMPCCIIGIFYLSIILYIFHMLSRGNQTNIIVTSPLMSRADNQGNTEKSPTCRSTKLSLLSFSPSDVVKCFFSPTFVQLIDPFPKQNTWKPPACWSNSMA